MPAAFVRCGDQIGPSSIKELAKLRKDQPVLSWPLRAATHPIASHCTSPSASNCLQRASQSTISPSAVDSLLPGRRILSIWRPHRHSFTVRRRVGPASCSPPAPTTKLARNQPPARLSGHPAFAGDGGRKCRIDTAKDINRQERCRGAQGSHKEEEG